MASHATYSYDTVANAAHIEKCYKSTHEGLFPLKFQVGFDNQFSLLQEKVLDEALEIFIDRALKESIIECAFSRSYKDLPESRDEIVINLFEALRPLHINGDTHMPSLAFINMYEEDSKSVGIGYLNLFFDTDKPLHPFGYRHYLHIGLNGKYLCNIDYYLGNDASYWAGVIAHEFLHNLGYSHPTGYKGSFIEEYGFCLQTDGKKKIEHHLINGNEDYLSIKPVPTCG
jgi:hypothetical protein